VDEIVEREPDQFKSIAPLNFGIKVVGVAKVVTDRTFIRFLQTAWNYEEAKLLHEWLGRALK
jgi:hypothetical protein